MRIFQSNFIAFSEDPFLRSDVNNVKLRQNMDISSFEKLSQYLTFLETGKSITREDYSSEETKSIHLLVRNMVDGDIDYSNVIYLNAEKARELLQYRLEEGDIVLAISSNCGLSLLYRGNSKYDITLSHYLCRLRVDENRLLPQYLVHYLNTRKMTDYFRGTETGKTQKNLSKAYIRQAPIVVPGLAIQERVIKEISLVNVRVQKLKEKVRPIQLIIDDVFSRNFNFDYEKFEELKTHKRFFVDISRFANNPDLRFSAKFHRYAGVFAMEQLQGITSKKIKHYLAEPIVLGASISPNDYSEDGEYCYISMATIKNWLFEPEDAKFVSKSYADSKYTKTVIFNDILMARSGEGTIGKVALIDDEELQGVFADFTMRIRLSNYNSRFAYYYFRTTYFQYLVEIYKKGLGNNTNIFPSVIREFPLPDISLAEQQRIVDRVKTEIEKQDSIRLKIADLRSQIDIIIEKSLC